jgi:hypothetical protein
MPVVDILIFSLSSVDSLFLAYSLAVKSLIPQSYTNRSTTMHQIAEVRVSVVADISIDYKISQDDIEAYGNLVRGYVTRSYTGGFSICSLSTAVLSCHVSYRTSLLTSLQKICEIKNPQHHSLLQTTLGSLNRESTTQISRSKVYSLRG